MPTERILFLGDVCAEPGREAVRHLLPGLKTELHTTFCIVNGENAAGGYGITPKLAEELLRAGADCITTGDHCFDRHELWEFLNTEERILRPLNFPPEAPGRGFGIYELKSGGSRIAVINLAGRVFMKPIDCPFQRIRALLPSIRNQTSIIIVDFHAEATAEKRAMGWFLAGQVSAVLGTHTHIQTADEEILPGGTAYITDVGMCGAFDSVLGMKKDLSLRRLIEQVPIRLQPADTDIRLNGVLIDIDTITGQTVKIERLAIKEPGNAP
ncbi:MAG: TIGR00282 family metallophosphoesterase [candidate division WOR-3 bacterium]|uniref:TIGR00282 family metallophosphoesterase n=2 Tax=candidate division WOR-3 bacterium TaxID=2052148 RepID=A0A7C3EGG8_UNCW3|nr:TIGR00282 family metallophosphoesterase [candidate division WOR-3 bacterium]